MCISYYGLAGFMSYMFAERKTIIYDCVEWHCHYNVVLHYWRVSSFSIHDMLSY